MSKCAPVAAQPLFWVTTTGFPKTIGLKHGEAQITWSTSLRLANSFRAASVAQPLKLENKTPKCIFWTIHRLLSVRWVLFLQNNQVTGFTIILDKSNGN